MEHAGHMKGCTGVDPLDGTHLDGTDVCTGSAAEIRGSRGTPDDAQRTELADGDAVLVWTTSRSGVVRCEVSGSATLASRAQMQLLVDALTERMPLLPD